MSLINKMLRDLDARHAATGQKVLPNEVRSLPEEIATPLVSRGVWILAGLVIVSAVAIQTMSVWLSPLAEYLPLPAHLLPTPVAPAPPPTTVVLQLPPPEQMLPLPTLPETAEVLSEAPTEQTVPAVPPQSAGLKIDSTLPDVPLAKPAPAEAPSKPIALPAKPAAPASKSARGAVPGKIEKQQRLGSAQERADAEYRKGVVAYKQGHMTEAALLFKAALQEEPRHLVARQTLLSMQAEQKQWDEVQTVLKEGLDLMPEQIAWAMALARIQVERGKLQEAWETLQRYMPYAQKSADYQGFAGVLLQRMNKPHEATAYYQAAVQLRPNEGRWWLGLGLAYEADGRKAEARDAFQHARSAVGLTPQMLAVIEQKLR